MNADLPSSSEISAEQAFEQANPGSGRLWWKPWTWLRRWNGPTRQGGAALAVMLSRVGIRESPPGSNRGPQIDRWNEQAGVPAGSPYCASCVHSAFLDAGYELGGGTANADSYCPALYEWGRENGYERGRPYRTYLILFDWDQDGVMDHVGMVERVIAVRWRNGRFVGLVRTVEANTSAGISGSQSNGDGVYRRLRWVNSSTRFLRIPDSAAR